VPAATGPFAKRWLALPVVLVAMFMAQFDLYVVNVSLPLLQHDMHAGQAALQLIVGGYAFMYATGLITGGRLGDMYGHRRLFVSGAVAFAVASLLAALSQTAAELVAFRLLQGLTASAMVPQVLATIGVIFPPAERPRALSWLGVTMGVGAVAGQVLGGVLLDINLAGLSWRPIFLVNVPIALAAAWLAARLLPDSEASARPKLDLVGTVGISAGLALILVPLSLGRSVHWAPWTWVCIAVSPVVLGLALLWERRLLRADGQPFLDLRLFQDRAFNLGIIGNVAAFGSFFSLLFTLTLLLQSGIGLSPLQAGLTFAPLGVAFAVASITARTLVARFGSRVITFGLLIVCAGLVSLFVAVHLGGGSTTVADVIGPMAVIGLGNGMSVPSLIGATLAAIRVKQAGAAAGVLTTAQQFASAAGVAALGSVLFAALGNGTGVGAYAGAIQWTTGASLILAAIAALVTTRLRRAAAG
jgi:EmrB/QacA subfamily drug resistance transporter